jgi:hypothetical protein
MQQMLDLVQKTLRLIIGAGFLFALALNLRMNKGVLAHISVVI